MLAPYAEPDHSARYPAQHRESAEQANRERSLADRRTRLQQLADDVVLHGFLSALDHARGEQSAALHPAEQRPDVLAACERSGQRIGRSHCILDRQVDTDAADRRHGVCGVADGEQARPMPLPQPVERYTEQVEVLPAVDFAQVEVRRGCRDQRTHMVNALGFELLRAALGDHQRALPVITAVDQHRNPAPFEAAAQHPAPVVHLADPKPEDVNWRSERFNFEHASAPDDG